jgi:hypothetical protein
MVFFALEVLKMGVFSFLKKKKEFDDSFNEGVSKEIPDPKPFSDFKGFEDSPLSGKGISEPDDEVFSPPGSRPFERSSSQSSPSSPSFKGMSSLNSQSNFREEQNDFKLVLSKLETIKAQLDFLQQKFENLERQIKKEDDHIKWR